MSPPAQARTYAATASVHPTGAACRPDAEQPPDERERVDSLCSILGYVNTAVVVDAGTPRFQEDGSSCPELYTGRGHIGHQLLDGRNRLTYKERM